MTASERIPGTEPRNTRSEAQSGAGRPVGTQEFTLPGDPVPWKMPKIWFDKRSGRRMQRLEDRQKERGDYIAEWIGARLMDGRLTAYGPGVPIALECHFWLTRPETVHYRPPAPTLGRNEWTLRDDAPLKPLGKPDLTNLLKGVEDGLVRGKLLPDDDQVVESHATKHYRRDRGAEGFTHVTIEALL